MLCRHAKLSVIRIFVNPRVSGSKETFVDLLDTHDLSLIDLAQGPKPTGVAGGAKVSKQQAKGARVGGKARF